MSAHDLFHRVETPRFQTPEVALLQEKSGEIWGRTAKWSHTPSVKAYTGLLLNRRGIEFTTETEPQFDRGSPYEVRWFLNDTPGVLLRCKDGEDFACVVANIDNRQR